MTGTVLSPKEGVQVFFVIADHFNATQRVIGEPINYRFVSKDDKTGQEGALEGSLESIYKQYILDGVLSTKLYRFSTESSHFHLLVAMQTGDLFQERFEYNYGNGWNTIRSAYPLQDETGLNMFFPVTHPHMSRKDSDFFILKLANHLRKLEGQIFYEDALVEYVQPNGVRGFIQLNSVNDFIALLMKKAVTTYMTSDGLLGFSVDFGPQGLPKALADIYFIGNKPQGFAKFNFNVFV